MQINIDVEIFDDPEYCVTFNSNKTCDYYRPLGCSCELFKRILKLSKWQNRRYAVKCDQCKEAYKKSKGIK